MPEYAAGITDAEKLERVVREYLAELDSPAPDYAMRRIYRERMAKLVGVPPPTIRPGPGQR